VGRMLREQGLRPGLGIRPRRCGTAASAALALPFSRVGNHRHHRLVKAAVEFGPGWPDAVLGDERGGRHFRETGGLAAVLPSSPTTGTRRQHSFCALFRRFTRLVCRVRNKFARVRLYLDVR
jgi:hypothetical protein